MSIVARSGAWLLASVVALLLVAHATAPRLVAATLPTISALFPLAAPEMRLLSLNLARRGDGLVLRARGDLARPLQKLDPGQGWMQIDLTMGGLLGHAVLLLALAWSWPARSPRHRAARMLVALPLAYSLAVITGVSTLVAELWTPFHLAVISGDDARALDWSQLLMGGGGAVLAILGAALVARCMP